MYRLQILNKILDTQDASILQQYKLDEKFFRGYEDELEFITNHYKQYNKVPDKETFIMQFPEFQLFECKETDKYLVEQAYEAWFYTEGERIIKQGVEYMNTDATDGIKYIVKQLVELNDVATFESGTDIIAKAMEYYTEYLERVEKVKEGGLLGITSGLKELDELTGGWMYDGEVVSIMGRTNEGKTWILLFFLCAAWKSGKRVLLYSGEMGKLLIAYRFHTLDGKVSNQALIKGDVQVKEQYEAYINQLKNEKTPFIVVTPSDLGGRMMNVDDLEILYKKHRPEIIGLDQLSLMEDRRAKRGDPLRVRMGNITKDLFLFSEKYKVPVLIPVQANRQASKQNKDDDTLAPELDHMSESDQVAHNSTRVISIKQMDNMMKLAVKKNRLGLRNQEIMCVWDINVGILKPVAKGTAEQENQKTNQAVAKQNVNLDGEDLF